ncbi:pentatricopeptide repeat-containing protein [Tanacetum coccineum]
MSSSSSKQQPSKPLKQFPSCADNVDISLRVRTVCEMLASVYPDEIETALATKGVDLDPKDVDEVLKLSYASPGTAVKFFRWAGLMGKCSSRTWNIIVDLLGKNKLFEQMWDAVMSMKKENVLSLDTFVSVFRSYCEDGKVSQAIMTFDDMDKYEITPDVVAVNYLLSAMCSADIEGVKMYEFVEKVKRKIKLDGDSYAILLKACEKEGNVAKAKTTFGEMVIHVGWDAENVLAYDALLITLVQGKQINEAVKFLQVMKGKNCFPGFKFFSIAVDALVKQNDCVNALLVWDIMVTSGLTPNLTMYNGMISLLCDDDKVANAFQLLDEMPFKGIFADSLTYNTIFQCLVMNKKVKEASKFFAEMIKNEQPPTPANCAAAISMFFDGDDPEMAFEVWFYMKTDGVSPLDDSANAILSGLARMGRLSELRRNAEKMMRGRIKIHESTMEKVKVACHKAGKKEVYDDLVRKWRSSS